ncbi:hypothetical protein AB0E62_39015 [Streptomyces sp. NPDC038707]|uniref:hypothetical protein n=1 Tax=Streptomyces sp. NPDC038707 TaxID=3154329 RepID=UPI0033D833B9
MTARPWRPVRGSMSLASDFAQDVRVRHMELEQYLFCRDVGSGGLAPDVGLDESFRGWRPYRNRAACELALLTGLRIQDHGPEPGPSPDREAARRGVTVTAGRLRTHRSRAWPDQPLPGTY